jgi:hypothetical protein
LDREAVGGFGLQLVGDRESQAIGVQSQVAAIGRGGDAATSDIDTNGHTGSRSVFPFGRIDGDVATTGCDTIATSKSLNGLRAQVSSATIEGFETYLTEFEAETQPTHLSIERVRKITQKLAALEGISGQDFKASSLIDRTCSALAVRIEEFQEDQDSRRPFLELQIGMLRSLQGNLAMRNGKPDAAKPALEEAVRRLEPLLDSQGLSGQTRSEALASWLKAISALGMHQAVLGDWFLHSFRINKLSCRCIASTYFYRLPVPNKQKTTSSPHSILLCDLVFLPNRIPLSGLQLEANSIEV